MAQVNGASQIPKLKNPSLFIDNKALINGEWVDAKSKKTFDVFNPSTGKKIATMPDMNSEDVDAAAKAAAAAWRGWKELAPRARGKIVRKWADSIYANVDDLGILLTLENGKPIPEAKGECLSSAGYLDFYAGEAERLYGDVVPAANLATRGFVIRQPIGVVACLCPWNFPSAMIARKAGGALAAGCPAIVKPAGETPLTANALAYLATQAGVPKGVINVVHAMENLAEVGKALCEHPLIRKLSFTGSTAVGKLLMSQCSGSLKKLSMELGGNSPFIVFDDAQISTAVETLFAAKLRNSGQTCISANRIYVQRGIYDELTAALSEKIKALKMGDGFESGVAIGPLTVRRGVDKIEKHIADATEKGATVVLGGKATSGNFFEPTIIKDMKPDMLSYREELFGPVAALYPFDTEEEVIELANNSDVGLGAYCCTNDIARMWRVAERLETGMVGVNTAMLAAAELPFGGVKHSGFGSEGGKWGVDEFMVNKTIVVSVPQAKI